MGERAAMEIVGVTPAPPLAQEIREELVNKPVTKVKKIWRAYFKRDTNK